MDDTHYTYDANGNTTIPNSLKMEKVLLNTNMMKQTNLLKKDKIILKFIIHMDSIKEIF